MPPDGHYVLPILCAVLTVSAEEGTEGHCPLREGGRGSFVETGRSDGHTFAGVADTFSSTCYCGVDAAHQPVS